MDDAPVLEPDPSSVIPDMGSGTARAGFVCGVLSFVVTLLAALFASGLIPDWTSGEGMLLFLFVALPLA